MSLALRLLDGVEGTVHATSTPSTRDLEGAPRRQRVGVMFLLLSYPMKPPPRGRHQDEHYYKHKVKEP